MFNGNDYLSQITNKSAEGIRIQNKNVSQKLQLN